MWSKQGQKCPLKAKNKKKTDFKEIFFGFIRPQRSWIISWTKVYFLNVRYTIWFWFKLGASNDLWNNGWLKKEVVKKLEIEYQEYY